MADNDLNVGVDLDLGNLNRETGDAAAQLNKMVAAIAGMAAGLTASTQEAKGLAENFKNLEMVVKRTSEQTRALRNQLNDLKSTQKAEGIARKSILDSASPTGGTLRDAGLVNFNFKAIETALNSSGEQIAARLKETMLKIGKRLEDTTDQMLKARLNETSFRTAQKIAKFTSPEAIQAATIASEARQIQSINRYAKYGSGADYLAASEAEKAARASNKSTFGQRLGARFETFSDYAAIGTGFYAIKQAVLGVADLDDAMKRFQAITETSNAEMGKFQQGLLQLASTSKYSVSELTEVATTLGQTGLSASGVVKALPAVTALATAAGAPLKEAVDAVASALGAYNLDASRAVDIANVMTAALNKTKLTMQQLQLGFSYSANVAKEAGVSFTELSAILGGLAQAGIRSGSTLGTGTRQLIQDLLSPSEKLKNVMDQLGVTLSDIDIKTHGLVGVLDNLRAKGFGSAEALRSLDLRAASAFTALAGQSETVKQLQQSLLLTDAASTGAAKASESLYAAFTRLGNTTIAILSQAFGPLVELLKKVVDGLSGMLGVVNQLGFVLPVMGTALAGIVASGAISGVVAGFASISALLSRLPTLALGAVAALRAVQVAMLANPLFAVGAIASTAALAAISIFSSNINNTQANLDKLKGTLNELQEKQQTIETNISGAGRMIDDLSARREKLNNDPLLRRTAIIEAQQAFKELGLSVSSSSDNIDVLIEALRKLRGELAKELPQTLRRRVVDQKKEISLMTQQSDESDAEYRSTNRARRNRLFASAGIGDQTQKVFDFLDKPTSQIDTSDVRGQTAPLVGLINDLRKSFEGRGDDKTSSILKMLDQLYADLEAKTKRLQNLQGKGIDLQSTERSAEVKTIQSSELFQRLSANREDQYKDLRAGYSSVMGNQSYTISERAKRLADLSNNTQAQSRALMDDAEALAEEFARQGFSPEAIRQALEGLRDSIISVGKGVIDQTNSAAEAANKMKEAELKQTSSRLKAEIATASSRAQKSRSQSEIDSLQAYVTGREKQLAEVDEQLLRRGAKDQINGILNSDEQLRLEELRRENDAKAAKTAQDFAEFRRRTTERDLQDAKRLVTSRKDGLESQISAIERELKDPATTRQKAQELLETLNKLFDQLKGVLHQGIDIDAAIQANKGERNNVIIDPSKVSPGTVQAQVLDALKAIGASDRAGTAFSFAQHESQWRPNVSNERGSGATGLFQFMPKTWMGLGGGNMYDVDQQVTRFVQYIKVIEGSLRKAFPDREISDEDRYLGWQQGPKGAVDLLSNPNALAKSVVGRDAVSMNLPDRLVGQTDTMTAQEFVKVLTEGFRASQAKAANFGNSTKQMADQETANQKAARTRELETQQQKDIQDEAHRRFRAQAILDAKDSRVNRLDIQSKESALKNTIDPAEARRLLIEIVTGLASMMKRELAQLENDPAFKDLSQDEKEHRRQQIQDKYAQELDRKGQGYASTVGDKELTKAKQEMDRLNQLKELYERDSSKAIPGFGSISDLEKAIDLTKRQLEILDPIKEKTAEIEAINEQIRLAKELGLGDEQTLNELLARRNELERERGRLQKKGDVDAQVRSSEGSLSGAFKAGTDSYFKSSGMLKANGDFKTFTEQMAGYWDQALKGMDNSMSQLFTDLASGTKTAGDAFRAFGQNILQTMIKIVSDAATKQLLKMFTDMFSSGSGSIFGSIGSAFGFNQGGMVPAMRRAALGTYNTNRDSVPVLARPGEYILRNSAVDAIGRGNLDMLNTLGNRRISQAPIAAPSLGKTTKDEVNVWVVAQDQVPPPGPKDIVAAVVQNAEAGGQIKQLIKKVTMGG